MSNTFSSILRTSAACLCALGFYAQISAQVFSEIDGSGHNSSSPTMGAIHDVLPPLTGQYYFSDNIGSPSGTDRPNPRAISNAIFAQGDQNIASSKNLSDLIWVFGQLLDHDITFVTENPNDQLFIRIPKCDPIMDPRCLDRSVIVQSRSDFRPGTGQTSPREFENTITTWIDGSSIYGSTEERVNWLRTFTDGKLHVSEYNLLPLNTTDKSINGFPDMDAPHMDNASRTPGPLFVAGDARANENTFLIALHTLFHREHNTVCNELLAAHPELTDEEVFQRARKIVGAKLQAIVYYEWLPALGVDLDPYRAYDSTIDARISNEFSAAAFRFGHTMLNSQLLRTKDDCEPIVQGHVSLRNSFFDAADVYGTGIDPLIKGMASQTAQEFDAKVIDDVRNFLFIPNENAPFGLDLVALNIMRGRERGIADYNSVRSHLGLAPIKDFGEISNDSSKTKILRDLYDSVEDIDLWVGLLNEDPSPSSIMGETLRLILFDQFRRLRNGDKFYFENDPYFSPEEKESLRATTIASIVRRNTNIQIQEEAFYNNPLCIPSSVADSDNPLEVFVAPNPTNKNMSLTVSMKSEVYGSLIIRNAQGQLLREEPLHMYEGVNVIPMSLGENCPSGVYFITITTGSLTKTCRVVKTEI